MMRRKICRRWTNRFRIALLASVFASLSVAHAVDWNPPLDAAVAQAKAHHAPLLIDFHAAWCYSCYYMARNVLNGAEWDETNRLATVVEIDVDSPDGAYWKDRLKVQALPSYLVVNTQGQEQGRIVGEKTRSEFYRQLEPMLSRDGSFDALQTEARGNTHQALKAARKVPAAYAAREDADGGLHWIETLPHATYLALQADPKVKLDIARLRLMKAAQAKDAQQCAALAPEVFAGELGCDRGDELGRVMQCTAPLALNRRRALLASQKPAMAHLLTAQVFSQATPTCADVRSEIFSAEELDRLLGYPAAATALLDRAIADTQQRLASGTGHSRTVDLKKDRNLADNLRAFLDHAGRHAALDALYPQLIAAYPDDYVYSYRYAKSLAARGQAAQALPFLQQALPKAYGVNRLDVALLESNTLQALNRAEDARTVVADTLKANGPWFPEKAAELKASVAAQSP